MKLLSYQDQIQTGLVVSSARMAVVSRAGLASPVVRPISPVIPAAPLFCAVAQEGEDALLNGMTRSLQRRLFGLNIPSVPAKSVPAASSAAKAA